MLVPAGQESCPAPTDAKPPLEQWAKDIKDLLHDIGLELCLREGFEYDEILPALRELRSPTGGSGAGPPPA